MEIRQSLCVHSLDLMFELSVSRLQDFYRGKKIEICNMLQFKIVEQIRSIKT